MALQFFQFPVGFDSLCIEVCLKSQDGALVQLQIL